MSVYLICESVLSYTGNCVEKVDNHALNTVFFA